jgi:predicted RNA-binding Zn-ribbon protein involved in translation (DUF1610 family)
VNFILLDTFVNYVEANIIMGRLQEDGINCWLKDENTVTIDPILTNAVGGIKLMVAAAQAERAATLLREYKTEKQNLYPCPRCGSKNIELVTTPRKPGNWISVIIGFLFTAFAVPVEKVYHCFNCGYEFDTPKGEK